MHTKFRKKRRAKRVTASIFTKSSDLKNLRRTNAESKMNSSVFSQIGESPNREERVKGLCRNRISHSSCCCCFLDMDICACCVLKFILLVQMQAFIHRKTRNRFSSFIVLAHNNGRSFGSSQSRCSPLSTHQNATGSSLLVKSSFISF